VPNSIPIAGFLKKTPGITACDNVKAVMPRIDFLWLQLLIDCHTQLVQFFIVAPAVGILWGVPCVAHFYGGNAIGQ
jgi:hypothetical protein